MINIIFTLRGQRNLPTVEIGWFCLVHICYNVYIQSYKCAPFRDEHQHSILAGASATGGYYYGAPPTSSVGPGAGAAAAYRPPPPTSSYQSYPPPTGGPPPCPRGPYGGQPSGPPPGIDPELWTWFQVRQWWLCTLLSNVSSVLLALALSPCPLQFWMMQAVKWERLGDKIMCDT